MMAVASIALAVGGALALIASDWVHALERDLEQHLTDPAETSAEDSDPARIQPVAPR